MKKYLLVILILTAFGCGQLSKINELGDRSQVILLGESHNQDQSRIMKYLKAMGPDLVLLELPADLLNLPNAPSEEAVAALEKNFVGWRYCKESGADCLGFDMQGNDLINLYGETQIRQELLVDALIEKIKSQNPTYHKTIMTIMDEARCGDLNQKNSESCDLAVERKHKAVRELSEKLETDRQIRQLPYRDALKVGNIHWQRRNQAMAQNICSFSEARRGETIVVIIGYEHKYILKPYLEKCGVKAQNPKLQ